MHTTYHKISARERDSAPRFYYKRAYKHSWTKKVSLCFRQFVAFLFTQVGVCTLVAAYMVMGAFVFASIEADSQMEQARWAQASRQRFVQKLWNVTLHTNVIYEQTWRSMTNDLMASFQNDVVRNVKSGYTGGDVDEKIWTFTSALMYSLTIFTTIGYGNLTPRTNIGKLATMVYALVGIPLMLLYMTTIGSILASSFKYTYTKLCRCRQPNVSMPQKASLPSALVEAAEIFMDSSGKQSKQSSNNSSNEMKVSPSTVVKPLRQLRKNDASPRQLSLRRPSIVVQDAVWEATSGAAESNPTSMNYDADQLLQANHLSPATTPVTPTAPNIFFRTNTLDYNRRKVSPTVEDISNDRVVVEEGNNAKVTTVEFKLVEDLRLVTIPVTSCLLVLGSYIFLGTVLFSTWEGWSYFEGTYFCFISLMTIGFGDFVPGNNYIYKVVDEVNVAEANAKLILATIYILLGMAILAMCLNLMQEKIVAQVRKTARKLGLIRSTRFDDLEDN